MKISVAIAISSFDKKCSMESTEVCIDKKQTLTIDREDSTMNLILILEKEHFQFKIWEPKEWIVV